MARLIEKLDGLKMIDNSQYIFELQSNLEPIHTEALTTTIVDAEAAVHTFTVKEYGYVDFDVTDTAKILVDISAQIGTGNTKETYYLYVKNTGSKLVKIGLGGSFTAYAHLEPGAIMLMPIDANSGTDVQAVCPTTDDASTLACYLFGQNVSIDATNNDFS
jgi:hypothetical protein